MLVSVTYLMQIWSWFCLVSDSGADQKAILFQPKNRRARNGNDDFTFNDFYIFLSVNNVIIVKVATALSTSALLSTMFAFMFCRRKFSFQTHMESPAPENNDLWCQFLDNVSWALDHARWKLISVLST